MNALRFVVLMNILRIVCGKRALSPKLQLLLNYRSSAMSSTENPTCPPYSVDQQELRKRLSPMQFHCTQEKGTERPFTGKYLDVKEDGTFACVVCGHELFSSTTKYNSGSGWPSFSDVIEKGNVRTLEDNSHGMHRIEVNCSKCGAHLGHVFDDGPTSKGGLRYCINSASLNFSKANTAGDP